MFGWIAAIALAALASLMLAVWLIGERGHLMLPSMRHALREYGWWRLLTPQGIHLFFYGRWPRVYLGTLIKHLARWLRPSMRSWLANHYHGKVLTPDHARSIIQVERAIPLQDLEQIIPYATARQLVLQGPPQMAVLECPCRAIRENPCQPTDVCLIIGQPFVDLVLEHHVGTSRRIAVQEALEILEAEHRRGHVHSAWFKDACLNRFFAICNCCSCCCGGIELMVRRGVPMMASSGFVAEVDPHRCRGCGQCQQACAFHAVQVNGRAEVNAERCMGCGVCVDRCPEHALSLRREPRRGVPLDVSAMN